MYMPVELQRVIQGYARPRWTRPDWRTCRLQISREMKRLIRCLDTIPLDTFYERIRCTLMPFERYYNTLLDLFPIRRLRSDRY
jgi:hypothetical protein